MSTIIRDSVKPYAVLADAEQNMWDVIYSGVSLQSTYLRYSTDRQNFLFSASSGTSAGLLKASPTNDTTCCAFFALYTIGNLGNGATPFTFQVIDTGNSGVQCTVAFNPATGAVQIYSGAISGTLIGTYVSAFSGNQWNGWNIQIVVNNTTGSVTIAKNGATVYTLTGVNTRGGSTNSYANQYALVQNSFIGSSAIYCVQDIWFYNGTGAYPAALLGNDVRTFWQGPNLASQTQFAPSSIPTFGPGSAGSNTAYSANTEYASGTVAPTYNGTIASIAIQFASAVTGSVILGIYDNTGAGGSPGNLLATSNAQTNPSGTATFTFASPASVAAGSLYYCAVLGSGAMSIKSSGSGTGWSLAQAYASGFSNPGGMASGSVAVFAATWTYTSNNYTCVSELAEDGATTTVSSSTVGGEDRYGVTALPITPAQIYGVQLRAFGEKSDSGSRSGSVTITSSGVNVVGTAVALATSFENIVSQQDTDPNTGSAWTASGLNAALLGVKVTA